jgi:hypothetical protein
MGGFPSWIIAPIVVLGVLGVAFVLRRVMTKQWHQTIASYAEFTLAELSRRLGLQIVEGPPDFNLMTALGQHQVNSYSAAGGVVGAVMGDGVKETRARMIGAPFGRTVEFVYRYNEYFEGGVVENVIYHAFECRLSAQVATPFPDFEIVPRNQQQFLTAAPELGLPVSSFCAPAIDASLVLYAADPRVGPLLAPIVAPLTSFPFYHLVGRHGWVHSRSDQFSTLTAAYYLEAMERIMEQIACLLEGKPAPALQLPPLPVSH